ncbi:MAG TPA: hypothetical protein VED17_10910, partial [Nitrososphaerales archaeon]|nr:hypothetical protein [Nitrososphaerales archaeon]
DFLLILFLKKRKVVTDLDGQSAKPIQILVIRDFEASLYTLMSIIGSIYETRKKLIQKFT